MRGAVERADGRLEKFGNFALGGLGVVGLAGAAGLIYTIITRYILSGQGVAFGIFVSLFIVFAVLALVFVILNENQKEKMAKRTRPPMQPEIEAPDTSKLLNTGRFEPVPSVIEDTTELLKVESRTRKL